MLNLSKFKMNSHGEKCSCEKAECTQESDSSNSDSSLPKDTRKGKISLTSLGLNLRRGRSLKNKRSKKCSTSYCCVNGQNDGSATCANNIFNNVSKKTKWPLKFYSCKKEQKPLQEKEHQSCCKCTCYKRTDQLNAVTFIDEGSNSCNESRSEVVTEAPTIEINVPENNSVEEIDNSERIIDDQSDNARNRLAHIFVTPNFIDLHWRTLEQEDVDEEARIQRAREIERGVDPPPSFRPTRRVQLFCSDENEGHVLRRLQIVCPNDVSMDSLRAIFQNNVTFRTCPLDIITGCHTQVDFIHCLVPDLLCITNCSFYWGKMDRYEAERLLDGKREGTFLLRDSAQEEFLFSVSFRKYGRSLHARIEQWNHKFSFDSHDPGVYTSNTVCGLIEHYKDPSSCMFFEPMLTWPLHRNFVFSLQHLCRANIVNRLTYDDVNQLQLPKSLKTYLKEYHYRQKVRVERFDDDVQWLELRNTPT